MSATSNNKKISPLYGWIKLITVTSGSHILVQTLGFVAGLIVIHTLPVKEYAQYTLITTMLGAMTVLTDGGILTGVLSIGGKVWREPNRLGSITVTAMRLRRPLIVLSIALFSPVTFILLTHHGASIEDAGLLTVVVLLSFSVSLNYSILEIIPRLHQKIFSLQSAQLIMSTTRLCLLGVFLKLLPNAAFAQVCAGIGQFIALQKIRQLAVRDANLSVEQDSEVRTNLVSIIKRSFPGGVYYCTSSQITIWIISVLGTTENVAQLGALGRLAAITGIITALISNLVEPRFSRTVGGRGKILRRYFLIHGFIAIFCGLLISIVISDPQYALFLLGARYENLTSEAILFVISSCITLGSSVAFKLNNARGIIPPPAVFIPTIIIVQILAIMSLNLGTVSGALYFGIIQSAATLSFRLVHFVIVQVFLKDSATQKATDSGS